MDVSDFNLKMAPKNKRILENLRKKNKYPVGCYKVEKQLQAGIDYYTWLIERRKIK